MDYGFDPSCKEYKKSRELLLANRLKMIKGVIRVEVGGLYRGVRIRKLPRGNGAVERIIDEANKIYEQVMLGRCTG